MSGVVSRFTVSPLPIIQLLQHRQWQHDVVVLEGLQSVGGLEEDIGVQHIGLLHTLRLPFYSAGPPCKGANRR